MLLRTTFNSNCTYENKYIEAEKAYAFLQVLTRGKINLYFDTRLERLYVDKANSRDRLFYYNYHDPHISGLFDDSNELGNLWNSSPEMNRSESFIKLIGIYNLEADNNLKARYADYVITNQKDTMTGTVAIRGLFSSYLRGTVDKVTVSAESMPGKEFKGSELKTIVRHINNTPFTFDAYDMRRIHQWDAILNVQYTSY